MSSGRIMNLLVTIPAESRRMNVGKDQPIIQPLITSTLRSASGQDERPGGSPGSRTLRGVAH